MLDLKIKYLDIHLVSNLVGSSLLFDVSACFPLVDLSTDEKYDDDDDDDEEGEKTQEWVWFGWKLYWGKRAVCQVLGTVLSFVEGGTF